MEQESELVSMGKENMVLIPPPSRHTGTPTPLLDRLPQSHDTEPREHFKDRPNGQTCEESAKSANMPHNIIGM